MVGRNWKRVVQSVSIVIVTLATCAGLCSAGDEKASNKVTAYLAPGADSRHATVTVWVANANPIIGMTIPLKFAGIDSLAVDSVVHATGRAAAFMMPPPALKSEGKTLLVNLIRTRDASGKKGKPIPTGEGPVITVFLSSNTAISVDTLKLAAVRLPPENTLLFVAESLNSIQPDFELVRKPAPVWTGKKRS